VDKLETFDWNHRPSRSRYAEAFRVLEEDGVEAVRLKRGEDFPAEIKMDSVKGGIRNEFLKRGRRARTREQDDGTLVVGFNPDPAPPRRRARVKQAAGARAGSARMRIAGSAA
jgi:hypothetical protein